MAFERHATSKIRSAEDLNGVKSMGFRGEALASIAAIANVEMISKTEGAESGNRIVVEGGKIIEQEEIGCQKGTTITVTNLFFNTPVRYKFLRKDYDKLYTQDFICHGVPSPRVWRKYLKETNNKYSAQPKKISFRSKDNSWQDFELKIQYKNNVYRNTQGKDTYLRAFLNDICLRDSCYKCNFKKKNRVSDITLADFWGIDNIDKSMNDDKGTSLVVVNSDKGKELFEKLKDNMEYKEVNLDDAIKYNMNMITSVKMNKNREKFFNELDETDLDSLVKKYIKKRSIVRRVLGKAKRIVKKILKK